MAYLDKIDEVRKQYEDLAVVCYINSTAEVKAASDICVTSSNAVKIVKALKEIGYDGYYNFELALDYMGDGMADYVGFLGKHLRNVVEGKLW